MSHINIDNLFKLPDPIFLPLLLVLKQAPSKDVSYYAAALIRDDESLDVLVNEGYIKYIKKGETKIHRMRLTPKANKFLNELTVQPPDEDDEIVEEWLHGVYSKRPNYHKSNRKQTKRLINWFKTETGIEKNELSNLFLCFLNDTFVSDKKGKEFWKEFDSEKESNPRLQLSNKLENLIWKSTNPYSNKFKLEESALFAYYESFREHIDLKYNEKN